MTTPKGRKRPPRPTKTRLDKLVEEAVVDAYDEDEQTMGFYTMIDDNLPWPFETVVLGVPVIVEKLDLRGRNQVVAICKRGAKSQWFRKRRAVGTSGHEEKIHSWSSS